jgi:hypothetical protein
MRATSSDRIIGRQKHDPPEAFKRLQCARNATPFA